MECKFCELHNIIIFHLRHKIDYLLFSHRFLYLQAKEQLYLRTSLPIDRQRWDGWPQSVTDDTVLAACKLTLPVHNFSVTGSPRSDRPNMSRLLTNTTATQQPISRTFTIHSDSEDSNCAADYDMDDLDMESISSSSASSRQHLS